LTNQHSRQTYYFPLLSIGTSGNRTEKDEISPKSPKTIIILFWSTRPRYKPFKWESMHCNYSLPWSRPYCRIYEESMYESNNGCQIWMAVDSKEKYRNCV